MGNNISEQQQREPQQPFWVQRRQQGSFSPPPVRRPQRQADYRDQLQDWSVMAAAPYQEDDPLAEANLLQPAPPNLAKYKSNPICYQEQEEVNNNNVIGQRLQPLPVANESPVPQGLQLYQAEPQILQGFASSLAVFDRYKKQGNARAMQAFQIIDNCGTMGVQQFATSLYLLQEGLQCYGLVPLAQVKQSLQLIEVEKQKISQQMITLQHQRQLASSLGSQSPREQLSSSQLHIHVGLSQQSQLKQKLTLQQISAADEILRVHKNKRVCLKALLEKSQEGLVAVADPGGAAQGVNARQLLESQLGLSQAKIEDWIFQLVYNQNEATHFLNEYIRMVENDAKVNQTQARLGCESATAADQMTKGLSAVSNQRSDLNFKQSKISERSSAQQNPNNRLLTIASNEPQEQLCQENMNNLSQLKEKLVENLDSLLFLLDEKKIQKHLKAMYLLHPAGSFLEYKRDFYTKLYSVSSPLSMSFNRHVAWKLSGILCKLSVQCQTQLNIGDAGEHARAANQYFMKYKELTKQLSKQPELEQINYLQHRQFLTKERFERNRQRVADQLARVQELVDGKSRAVVTAHFHQAEELGAEPHQLVSLNNEGEIGTLSRGAEERLSTNPILSPGKEPRKLLTEVYEQYPHDMEDTHEARLVAHAKKPSFNAVRLQQQRSCFPRNRSKQSFNSHSAIGPFGQKATYDLRELALSREKQAKKAAKPSIMQSKNYVKMNQQPQKRLQQQELRASQENISKIVKRTGTGFSTTLSPRSDAKTPEDAQQLCWDGGRPLSPDNVKFMSDQQTKIEDSPKRKTSQSSGTPRGSAYNILKPFQQQQQPFYAPSTDDLAISAQYWYKDPNQKEKRKISLSPRERGHQESQSTDQTPPAALNMDINNLQKPSSILQMSAWNQVGPLSVISEEKPHLLGTTAGGHSVSGGPPAFNGDHSPEPRIDPSYQDHTVVKGFKLPTTNPSVDSPDKSTSRSPIGHPKPLDPGDLNKLQRLYGKDQRLKVTQVMKRQTSKEKELKRKKEHRRRPTADLQETNKFISGSYMIQDAEKDKVLLGKSQSASKTKSGIEISSSESMTPRMKGKKREAAGKAKTEVVSSFQSAQKEKKEDEVQVDVEEGARSDDGDEGKLDAVRETGEEESTINQTSGFIKEAKPVVEETSKSSKKEVGSAAKERGAKDTPGKGKKAGEPRSGAGQKDSQSQMQQPPSSIYRYLLDKDRKSPTFSPSAAAQHFRSTDPLPKQGSGTGVSDSSQIQIKVGQKPIKNINQRQFVPRSKLPKPSTQLPFAHKTASLASTQHEKSRDTTNQTNSGSKVRLELDQTKHQLINETLQKSKEERLQPSEPKKSEGRSPQKGERPVTPKAFEIVDEDSLLTQKYLEAQKPTTDKKEDPSGRLNKYDISRKDFNILRKLGKGSFGEVYLVRFVRTGELFAMKALSKRNKEDANWMRYIITERDVLVKCQSPFIARLNYAFQTNTNMFLVLEFCTGYDLDKVLTFEKYLSEERAKLYTAELVLAVAELHQHDIIYRDLKPDNVVLDELGHVKLIDFGMSKEGITLSDQGARTFCGSVKYLAPEMLSKKGHGKSLDWYLIGVLFYEMLVGISPYYTSKKEDLFDNILYGKLKLPRSISNDARDLIMKLLNRSSKKRLGSQIPAQELLIVYDDNAVAEYERTLAEQFTALDLRKTGALQIMSHPFFRDINWIELYRRNFEALPDGLQPPKSKYNMEYHQNRYKESRYDSDDIERIWEQKNNKDFEEGAAAETDDLHVKNWSFIHEKQIETLENQAKAEEEARLLEAAREQEAIDKEVSLKQESSHQEPLHQIVEPVYAQTNQLVSPRVAPTIHSQISIESCSQGDFQKNPELGSHLGRRRHHSSETYRSAQTRKTRTRSYQSQFATKSGRRGLSSGAPAERRPKLDRFGSNTHKRSASLQSNLSGHKVSVQSCDALSINRLAKRKRRNHSNSDKNSGRSSRQGSHLHGKNYSSGSNGSSTISQYGIAKKQSGKNMKNIGHNQYRTTAQNEYRGNQIIIRLQNNAVGQFDIESKGKKKVPGGIARMQKKTTNPVTSTKRFGAPNPRAERMANEKKRVKEQQMTKPIGMPPHKTRPTSNLSGPSMGSRKSRHSKSKHSRNNSRSASRGPGGISLQNKNPLNSKKSYAQAAARRSLQAEKLGLGVPASKSSSLLKTMKGPTVSIKLTKTSDSESQLQPSIISNSLKTTKASAKGGPKKVATSKLLDKRGRHVKSTEQKRFGTVNALNQLFKN